MDEVKKIYAELKQNGIYETLDENIEFFRDLLTDAANENFKKYKILGTERAMDSVVPGDPQTYNEEVDFLHTYFRERGKWLDKALGF
jgi:hypothetical protein